MATFPISNFRKVYWPAVMAALLWASCEGSVDFGETGGNHDAGTGGQTGSKGVTAGSGGSIGVGSGGAIVTGPGGAQDGSGGSVGSGGSGGAGTTETGGGVGTAGRSGIGGSASIPDAGAVDGNGAGLGGAGGAATANLPAGYAVCVPCHGAEGAGVAGHGPEIEHPVVDFSTWVIRNGRMHPDFPEAMPKLTVDVLPDAQLQGIFSYLAARPKPTTGKAMFVDHCANCHGANAAGGVTMRPINNQPMNMFTTKVRGGHSAGQFAMRREFMPKWTTTQLTDAELRLIFMYVDGL